MITPSYRIKVLLFALLAYAYVFAVLAVVFTLFGLLLWTIISGQGLDGAVVRIEMALAVVAALFLRAIWVRVRDPQNPAIHDEDAPALLAMIHDLERMPGMAKLRGVVLSNEFNVALTVIPRWSLFSWPIRRYLGVGLPLMQILSPEQFKAMVVQELARFAGTRDPLGGWINVRRHTWHHLLGALLVRGGWGPWLFGHFFNWYVPRFNKYSTAFSREHIFESDRVAANATAPEVLAEALIRTECGFYLEEKYWDEQDKGVAGRRPVADPEIAELLQTVEESEAEAWLSHVLEETTHAYSSYPVLKDRLSALGQQPRLPSPIDKTAVEVYLGSNLQMLTQRLKTAQEERAGRAPMKTVPPVSRDPDELISRSQQPDFNAYEALELGGQLLEKDDERGVAFMEQAIEADNELITIACFHLANYYRRKGDLVMANRCTRRSLDQWELMEKARAERTHVSFVDCLHSRNLSEGEIDQLRRELAQHGEIKEAYLVRKHVRYLADKPFHALALVFDRSPLKKTADPSAFTKRLPQATTNPPELYAFVLDYRNRRVGKLIRDVTNSLIYQRD